MDCPSDINELREIGADKEAQCRPPEEKNEPERSWRPTVLVLGPGGTKGFLELGALLIFEKERFLTSIRNYVGVSVGAIISVLLVAGYSVTEIITDAMDVNLFQDISSINLNEIKDNVGLLSNRAVKEKLVTLLENKFGFVPTLHQFYMATGLTLTCVSLNLDDERTEYISWETEPTISAVDAVLLSMNIPLLFYQLRYKGNLYIDGAFGNPYPVDEYDDGKTNILGICITELKENSSVDLTKVRYIYKILVSAITQNRKRIRSSTSERCKHLELTSPTLDGIGLLVDIQMKSRMVFIGYNEAIKFIKRLRGELSEVLVYESSEECVSYEDNILDDMNSTGPSGRSENKLP